MGLGEARWKAATDPSVIEDRCLISLSCDMANGGCTGADYG